MPARIYTLPLEAPESEPERDQHSTTSHSQQDLGDVIDLQQHRKERRLEGVVAALTERLVDVEIPGPETFGWVVVERADGQPVRWFQPKYRALIGYVPGSPELVYLDRNRRCCAWSMTVEELALGLEFGTLPEPLHELDDSSDIPEEPRSNDPVERP